MSAAPRTVIHIGPGKTATTFLQARVFRNHSQINYLGKNHPNAELDDAIRKLTRLDSQRFPIRNVKKIFAAEIAAHPEKPAHLLSEELLGTWAFIDAHLMAIRLKDIFGPSTILVTLRNPIGWLESAYFWCLEVGKFNAELEFNDWVSYWLSQPPLGNVLSSLHTQRLVEIYASVFGLDNIKLVIYEDLRRDPAAFAHEIANIIGVGSDEMKRIFEEAGKTKGEKSRISQASADYFKQWNLVKGQDLGALATFLNQHLETCGRPIDHETFAPRIESLMSGNPISLEDRCDLFTTVYKQTKRQMPGTPLASATLTPNLKQVLSNRIGKQLRWVQETFDIDLASRGYDF